LTAEERWRAQPWISAVTAAAEPVLGSGELVALARWMDAAGIAGAGCAMSVERISGGASNEIFRIDRGGSSVVLRRPPAALSAQRSATMLREARVLQALAGTDVPHARLLAVCTDPAVLGSSFYVMELVDGWSPMSAGPRGPAPFDTDPDQRAGLGREVVRGISLLAGVDWRVAGLDGFGQPDGFHERQVDRWLSFLAKIAFRDIPGLDEAAAWLRGHRPRGWQPGLMHGDYSFANVMFAHGPPGRLAAIVDWEMSTVGDPLLDLGWLLMRWTDPGEDRRGVSFDLDGMPSRRDVTEQYARQTARDLDDIDYYVVLAAFKNAIVLEGGYSRYRAGQEDNPKMAAFGQMVLDSAAKAAQVARGSGMQPR
jgi:aminoglycoside phosphotransferase (APT) family kinase protein